MTFLDKKQKKLIGIPEDIMILTYYAQNIKEHILSLIDSCIPNKVVNIRPSDLPRITTAIKRQLRKRKRAYRKAKLTDKDRHRIKFRIL